MTTIVGIQQDDGCIIAADSLTTAGDRWYSSVAQPKVVESGDYLIACAGSSVACDVVMYQWKPPAQRETHLYRHVVTTVVPSLRRALQASDVTIKDDEGLQILLAYTGWLFQIESDYSVLMRDDGIYAIGSGSAYAIGAMHMGASAMEAVEIAADNDIYTGSPVIARRQDK